jgi:hypothetical protein
MPGPVPRTRAACRIGDAEANYGLRKGLWVGNEEARENRVRTTRGEGTRR